MIKKCLVFGKEFECYEKVGHHSGLRRKNHKRPSNALNCSSKCSKEYQK
jgi:hypothetical protein